MPALLALIDIIISSVSGMDLEASKRIPTKGPKWKVADIRLHANTSSSSSSGSPQGAGTTNEVFGYVFRRGGCQLVRPSHI